jgi:hypothetical protein
MSSMTTSISWFSFTGDDWMNGLLGRNLRSLPNLLGFLGAFFVFSGSLLGMLCFRPYRGASLSP